ncbi:MAG: rod shape-determining protein MreD, partial [Arenibacterium sp.]
PGETGFASEWATVCIVIIAITLGYRLLLGVTLLPLPSLGVSMIQMVLTILAYPLVVLVTQTLMGVRKLAPSDAGTLGGRP